jgi:glutamate 5-kinase
MVAVAAVAAPACVVLKIGSSSLVEDGKVIDRRADRVAELVSRLRDGGTHAVVVASGAIAVGRALGTPDLAAPDLGTPDLGTPEAAGRQISRELLAAVGQGPHYRAISAAFGRRGLACAQFLLTPYDLCDPTHGELLRRTLLNAADRGVVPIVNENDAVMVRNNDVLAALLAARLGASGLYLLTDVDGLYDRNPRLDAGARRIDVVDALTTDLERAATRAGTPYGTGGMSTKLGAAWIATRAGVPTVIARMGGPLDAGGRPRGTLIRALGRPADGLRNLWCAFANPPAGRVVCTPAGERAVAGRAAVTRHAVASTAGAFTAGEVVDLVTARGDPLGRGRARHAADEVGDMPAEKLLIHPDEYVTLLEV